MNVTISHIKLHFFQFMAYCLKDSRGLQAVRSLVYSMLDVPLPLESTRHSGLNHKSIHCELRWVDDLQGFLRPQDGRLKGPHSVALTNKNPHQMIIHRQIRGQSPALPCCQRKNTDRVRKTKKRNDRAKALHSWVRKRKGDVIVMGGKGGWWQQLLRVRLTSSGREQAWGRNGHQTFVTGFSTSTRGKRRSSRLSCIHTTQPRHRTPHKH